MGFVVWDMGRDRTLHYDHVCTSYFFYLYLILIFSIFLKGWCFVMGTVVLVIIILFLLPFLGCLIIAPLAIETGKMAAKRARKRPEAQHYEDERSLMKTFQERNKMRKDRRQKEFESDPYNCLLGKPKDIFEEFVYNHDGRL